MTDMLWIFLLIGYLGGGLYAQGWFFDMHSPWQVRLILGFGWPIYVTLYIVLTIISCVVNSILWLFKA